MRFLGVLSLLVAFPCASFAQSTADTLSAVFAAGRMDAHRAMLEDRREWAVHPGSYGAAVDAAFFKGMKQAGRRASMQTVKTRPDAIVIGLRDLRMASGELADSAVVVFEIEHCNPESGVWYRNSMRYPLVRVKHGGGRRDEWVAGERPMLIKASDGTCRAAGSKSDSVPPR